MNIKAVLRTYGMLRALTDDESALLQTLRQLNDNDRELLVDSLSDKPQKKPGKKGGGGKSKRAASLESTIKGRGSAVLCVAELASTGKPCGMARPHVIHSDHNPDVDAHDFLSAVQLQQQQEPVVGGFADDTGMVRCQFVRADGKPCHLLPDHNIHHLATANEYHEFQPLQQAEAAAGSGG